MPTQSSKKPLLIALAVIIIIAVAGFFIVHKADTTSGWTAYEKKDFGLSFKYPSSWHVVDTMTQNSCCLFVLNYEEKGTTTPMAAQDIKIQIGYYFVAGFDPFKLGSTTEITLGKNKVYKGMNGATPFYILPRSSIEGFGIAVFTPPAQQTEALKTVEDILSTIAVGLVPVPTSTSTPATAPTTTK